MIKKLITLLNVKSIVTITMTTIFCILSLTHVISSEQFMTVFTTVIAFYFGTQHQKNCDKIENTEDSTKNNTPA